MLRRRSPVGPPPDPETLEVEDILLATEAPPIPSAAIDLAARLARGRARVHVFSLARIWGTSLGFPSPGLYPSQTEWDRQRQVVNEAIRALEARGVDAAGRVTGTRRGAKAIVQEAGRLRCDAIVMAADPPRNRFVADFMWSQEPYRVRSEADVPVYLVERSVAPAGP